MISSYPCVDSICPSSYSMSCLIYRFLPVALILAPLLYAGDLVVTELAPYTVQGFDESAYGSSVSTTATRLAVPHSELPLLVNVVSEYLLEEQQAIDPSDAFDNISNVEAKVASPGQANQVAIRGFNSFTYIDGFRVGNSNCSSIGAVSLATEVGNLERIEVLKGSAATLYGRGLPGGVVNYVTKKPQIRHESSLSAQYGSFDLLRTVADTTGAFSEGSPFQYRVIASASDRASHRDEVEQAAASVYPSINWQIGEDASLLVRAEYQKVDYTPDQGALFLANGEAAPASSQSFFFGSASDSIEAEQFGLNAQLEASPNEFYTLRTLIGYRHAEQAGDATLGLAVNGAELTRVSEVTDDSREDFLVQVDNIFKWQHALFGDTEIGHRILLTADWQHGRIAPTSSEKPLDLFDIETGQSLGTSTVARGPNDFELQLNDVGIGAQDLITVNDRLHLLLGVRYDQSELDFDLKPLPFKDKLSVEKWSLRAGVIYNLTEDVSLFANYGSAFRPTFLINNSGQSLFESEESIQHEAGVKVDFNDGRFTLNTAIYQLTNKDVVVSFEADDTPIATDQSSLGFEVDLTARLSGRMTLLFNYALVETEYTDGPFDGNELFGTPKQSGGVWVNYDLIQSADQRLSFSLGLNYRSTTYATDANAVKLPAYFHLDAAIHYEVGQWRFRLNGYNLLDDEGFIASRNTGIGAATSPIYALPTAPASFRLSANYSF